MKQYALIIDHESCWGCKTCEVACKQENRAADGVRLISVLEEGPEMIDGKLDFVFRVNVCRHCDDPPAWMPAPRKRSKREKMELWLWITKMLWMRDVHRGLSLRCHYS